MINHAYGFEMGNKILLKITERLKNYLRKYDAISKLESDKFGIIIKDIKNEEDIYTILVTLIDNLSKPYIIEDSTIYISFNTGISIFPKDAKDAETLMEKAEIALFDVKNKEEGFGFYKENLKIKAKKRLKLKTALSNALKNREFILYYQTYFDIKTNKIAGAEALIRWKKTQQNHTANGIYTIS